MKPRANGGRGGTLAARSGSCIGVLRANSVVASFGEELNLLLWVGVLWTSSQLPPSLEREFEINIF